MLQQKFLHLWYPRYHAMLDWRYAWLILRMYKQDSNVVVHLRGTIPGQGQRHFFTLSKWYRNDKSHGGQFTSKQLLLDPAHARRAISVRTSAAYLTPQHLLADRLTAWTQAGWRQAISNHGITFFLIVGFFCWACTGKAGRLLINIPFRVASSAGCCGWKDFGLIAQIWISRGKNEHTLLLGRTDTSLYCRSSLTKCISTWILQTYLSLSFNIKVLSRDHYYNILHSKNPFITCTTLT